MPLYTTTPNPLPLNMGGLGASLNAPGVEALVLFQTGSSQAVLIEPAGNLAVSGFQLIVVPTPTFTDVSTTTINSLRAPSQGTYTPTYTNVTNVASFGTVSDLNWLRIGNTVFIYGRQSIDLTAINAFEFRMSIPIASNFSLFTDAGGSSISVNSIPAAVRAETVNDQLTVIGSTTDIAAHDYSIFASYRVI